MQFYLIICVLVSLKSVSSQEPTIEITQGTLRGMEMTNRDGGTFYGFRSIPYAKPPVNELRFMAPVPADGWEGIRDATDEIPTCTQYVPNEYPSTYGTEDCLHLNVFIPELPSEDATKKPVMVFIHGGSFMWASAASYYYGPEFLMTKDIILVTLNYRLGIFGAFSIDDADLPVPGNMGLRDQVLALKWVQDNIERFGGDSDNVLLFGDSAGSISSHLHMLSPLSAGLFTKVIGQSGTGLVPILGARNSGIMIAEQLGIQAENSTMLLSTLQELSATEISEAAQFIAATYLTFINPIVETPSTLEPFLDQQPINILLSGNYNHVSYLTGFNNLEGFSMGDSFLIEDFTPFVPADLQIAPGSKEESAIAQRIKEFYYGDAAPSIDDVMPAVDLMGDWIFCFPAYRAVVEHARTSSEPAFLYYFSLDTELNFMKVINPALRQYPGAIHGDERGYLFQNAVTPSSVEEGTIEDDLIKMMVDFWTNFAIYGHLTPGNSTVQWEPVREGVVNFLAIETNATYPDVNPRAANMELWSSIYEDYFPRR